MREHHHHIRMYYWDQSALAEHIKTRGCHIQLHNVIFLPTKSRGNGPYHQGGDTLSKSWKPLIYVLKEWNKWSFFIAYLPDYTASHTIESDCNIAAIGPQILWKLLVPFTVPISVFVNNTELLVVTWRVSFFEYVDFYVYWALPRCVMFYTCISSLYVLCLLSCLFLKLCI